MIHHTLEERRARIGRRANSGHTPSPSGKHNLSNFPVEILVQIFGYLDYRSVSKVRQVCKKFLYVSFHKKLDAIMFRQDRKGGAAEKLMSKFAKDRFPGSKLIILPGFGMPKMQIPVAHFPIELHPILREVKWKTARDGTFVYQWPAVAKDENPWCYEAAFSPGLDKIQIITGRDPLQAQIVTTEGKRDISVGMVLALLHRLLTKSAGYNRNLRRVRICHVEGHWFGHSNADGSFFRFCLAWPAMKDRSTTGPWTL
ncbi:hypothetical protein OC861_004127 [Tilletia horrida]|nr:hypothetical protein OC861_004127 [Tilletia horrida]